ncbi:hypothetical protein KUTeg_013285 [Tegillarca granosa]|uniref:D-aminoacyl-tRNA deacylase n=1 Tax=Tegillarca granosa TaxID=220873 RepID=A0ABQ9EWR3_TEGGR|nr:hypothetical protein KUTeg_013285 [Tegillarca granosa]
MKLIIQRVMKASVTVGDEVISSIGRGLCVLVGITRKDTAKEMEVFEDDDGKRWNKSVMDKQYEVLCVSQGNKPDYRHAMGPEESQVFYEDFLKQLGKNYNPEKIKDGKFGAYMQVHIQNDGPVTIPLETPDSLQENTKAKGRNAAKTSNETSDKKSSSSEVTAESLVNSVSETSLTES